MTFFSICYRSFGGLVLLLVLPIQINVVLLFRVDPLPRLWSVLPTAKRHWPALAGPVELVAALLPHKWLLIVTRHVQVIAPIGRH